MNSLIRLIAIAYFFWAVAFLPQIAIADNTTTDIKSSQSAQKAAQEVLKETGVKEQFGQSENGEQLLDQAKAKASSKLNDLAEKANKPEELQKSKQLFLKNIEK